LALTRAADIELEPIWASLLAKALEGKNVKDLLSNVGSGGGAPAAGAAPAAAATGGAATEAPKAEEKKEEKEEESDDDMVNSLSPFTFSPIVTLAFSGLWSIRLITLLYLHCHPSIFLLVTSLYCYHSRKASTSFIDIWMELSTCQKFHSFMNAHAPVAQTSMASRTCR
jgi:large subunit ribosomal protein LP1